MPGFSYLVYFSIMAIIEKWKYFTFEVLKILILISTLHRYIQLNNNFESDHEYKTMRNMSTITKSAHVYVKYVVYSMTTCNKSSCLVSSVLSLHVMCVCFLFALLYTVVYTEIENLRILLLLIVHTCHKLLFHQKGWVIFIYFKICITLTKETPNNISKQNKSNRNNDLLKSISIMGRLQAAILLFHSMKWHFYAIR